MEQEEAAAALRSVASTRAQMAMRARWSWGRHLAFGAVMGGLIASYALPAGWPLLGVALCVVAVGAIAARDRRRDGFFVNGYRPGTTRRISFALLGGMLLLFAGALAARAAGWWWAPLAAGLVVLIAATIASRAWERVYRAELLAER